MKMLSLIKSHKIISVLAVVVVVGATGGIIYATNQNNKVSEQPSVPQVSKVTEVTIPEKVEDDKSLEGVDNQSKTVAPTEKIVKEEAFETPKQLTHDEVYGYLNEYMSSRAQEVIQKTKHNHIQVINIISHNYPEHSDLFTDDKIDSTINACVQYLSELDKNEQRIAFAKNDCGF